MIYRILSLFPEIIDVYFAASIMARAVNRGIVGYQSVNIRDFALDKHHTCDDAPYGGGAGMLMLPEPLGRALEFAGARPRIGPPDPLRAAAPDSLRAADEDPLQTGFPDSLRAAAPGLPDGPPPRVIYLTPSGRPFTQTMAAELARERELILLCGRYEGIDQRIVDRYVDDEISVGDYVLSSGEVAALVIIDATYRLVERVIRAESLAEESFRENLLEYPQYTRPEIYATLEVPEVLRSGHHENIRRWRRKKQVEKTLVQRPDMIRQGEALGLFDRETCQYIEELRNEDLQKREDYERNH